MEHHIRSAEAQAQGHNTTIGWLELGGSKRGNTTEYSSRQGLNVGSMLLLR